ncbi:phosphonate ABC transporter, permease protein PhnE [Marinobacter daepoensis]|uniref:Phosphonate ABC transporter, permease protein PhnE n=2 Tax=Marinobacter daepoensis TaxID=262077 RepID=A0ABS3BEP1_9GAMM|nr:phosphonate ABC transporter, permease protein PhnE [Marinobacter daepoensis]
MKAILWAVPGLSDMIERKHWLAVVRLGMLVFVIYQLKGQAAYFAGLVLMALIAMASFSRTRENLYLRNLKNELGASLSIDQTQNLLIASIHHHPWWRRAPANWPWLELVAFVFLLRFLADSTQFELGEIVRGWPMTREFVIGFLSPDWSLLESAVFVYARQTLEVGLLGTLIGFVLAVPLSFICARNLASAHPLGRCLYGVTRLMMVVIRAMPTFLLGLIFVVLVGLGPFPGVLAISVFSLGVMVKLFSETIESVDMGPLEAIESCGGNWVNGVYFGILPQVKRNILAQLLYCAEINIHSATVLGLIGAEGIGLPIHEYLSAFAFSSASVFILVTIAMTVVIDCISGYLRNRILS